MLLNIFALLFVLGVVFVHSLFGLFSGLINMFCALAALAVSLGCTETVNRLVTENFHLPAEYSEAVVLATLFFLTLLILRLLADSLIRGNVRVPMYADWGGGAFCGFIVGQIAVGVMVLSFLLLPWGGRALMFTRVERDPENSFNTETGRAQFIQNNLWLRSDRFAVGLFNLLSNGSLRSSTQFASVYPDYAQWVFWTGNQVQSESVPAATRNGKVDAFDGKGLKVESWWKQTTPLAADYTRYRKVYPTKQESKPPFTPQEFRADAGHYVLGARLVLANAAGDRDGDIFAHRFRPSNIRLVGDIVQPDGSLEPRQYAPQVLGGADASLGDMLRIVELDENFSLAGGGDATIDAYFDVDEHFKPRFVEYRRYARAALVGEPAKTPPAQRLTAGAAPEKGGKDTGHGVARFIDAILREGSGDRDRLPFAVSADKASRTPDFEVKNGVFVSGRIDGEKAALAEGGQAKIEKIELPEGKRVFQLATKPRQVQSLPGKVFNFVGARLNQYQAVDREGNSYMLAGFYAVVKRDGKDFVEMSFSPEPTETGSRGMVELKSIQYKELEKEDSVLGLIFLVPPEKCIVAVSSQGGRVDFGTEFCMGK